MDIGELAITIRVAHAHGDELVHRAEIQPDPAVLEVLEQRELFLVGLGAVLPVEAHRDVLLVSAIEAQPPHIVVGDGAIVVVDDVSVPAVDAPVLVVVDHVEVVADVVRRHVSRLVFDAAGVDVVLESQALPGPRHPGVLERRELPVEPALFELGFADGSA